MPPKGNEAITTPYPLFVIFVKSRFPSFKFYPPHQVLYFPLNFASPLALLAKMRAK
jgi:hypothetical protein